MHGSTTQGVFKYLDSTVSSSLYRNGRVLTRRDTDGSDAGTIGVSLEDVRMPVDDARTSQQGTGKSLEHNGFELHADPGAIGAMDFFDHAEVARTYYPACAELVQKATGAAVVRAFDHNVRSASGKQSQRRITGGQQVQGPAHVVHGDYTLHSAAERLRALAQPPSGNDTLRQLLGTTPLLRQDDVECALSKGRFAIINVWRNITDEPVQTHPLALCDALSVMPQELVVFEIHYADRVGENYFSKHSAQHRWYYYPHMTGDEALLIKQWDSAGELARSDGKHADAHDPSLPCTFSFHSAFEDPLTPEAVPDRWSIEVRCAALYG